MQFRGSIWLDTDPTRIDNKLLFRWSVQDTVNLSADGIAGPSRLLNFTSFYSAQVVSINSVRLSQSAITQYLPVKLQYLFQ